MFVGAIEVSGLLLLFSKKRKRKKYFQENLE